jgi:hypothetical protein
MYWYWIRDLCVLSSLEPESICIWRMMDIGMGLGLEWMEFYLWLMEE